MAAFIRSDTRTLPISTLGPFNRYPKFRFQFQPTEFKEPVGLKGPEMEGFFRDGLVRLLPYTPQETYDRAQALGTLPTLVLENERMRATIYPQFGGRLASLYDKQADRELLFDNPVFQPANLAIRNAWFSGGIEWNGPVYGHSLLTCSDVYVARVVDGSDEFMRIYEFDRSLETAWQVDLRLDDTTPGLWVHVKVLNLNDYPVDYYWWTNIAVPQTSETRVLTNDSGRAVRHMPDQSVRAVEYPHFSDFDGSYPARYRRADSIFFELQQNQMPWIAYADADGKGLVHASTRRLVGRKMFTWGTNPGARRWLDLLSQPKRGDYVEIQAGLRPTQLQTIPLPAQSGMEWTECIAPLDLEPGDAHHPEYSHARDCVQQLLTEGQIESVLAEQDAVMCAAADLPVAQNLWRGSAWGGIFEKAVGRQIAASMTFDAEPTEGEKPWAQLSEGKGFGTDDKVGDWVYADRWIDLLQCDINAGNEQWQHHLHRGVKLLEEEALVPARMTFELSNSLKENEHAWRNLGLLDLREGHIGKAVIAYQRAMEIAGPQIEIALEYGRLLFEHRSPVEAEAFLETLPEAIASHERIQLLLAEIALCRSDLSAADRILAGTFATIRENENTLTDLWYAARFQEEAKRLGRDLTEPEKRQYRLDHEPPRGIDFRMNLEEEQEILPVG